MAGVALTIFLTHIHRMIPKQILQAAFGPGGPNNWNGSSNIDKRIKEEVWLSTLNDINLHCGKYRVIQLRREWKQPLSREYDSPYVGSGYYSTIYRIPPQSRDFGPITQVGKLECISNYTCGSYMNGGMGGNFVNTGNTVMGLAAASLSSRTLAPHNNVPTATLLDNQTVRVMPDDILYSSDLRLHCLIGYDQEMTNAEPSVIEAVKKLLLCDTKIYIYNNLDIAINETEVSAGSEISRFKERVMEYSSAAEEREELLDNVSGAKYYDPEIFKRLMWYSL